MGASVKKTDLNPLRRRHRRPVYTRSPPPSRSDRPRRAGAVSCAAERLCSPQRAGSRWKARARRPGKCPPWSGRAPGAWQSRRSTSNSLGERRSSCPFRAARCRAASMYSTGCGPPSPQKARAWAQSCRICSSSWVRSSNLWIARSLQCSSKSSGCPYRSPAKSNRCVSTEGTQSLWRVGRRPTEVTPYQQTLPDVARDA